MSKYRTAESVSPGHPDKLCDQISDAVLDAYLKEDPKSRVAIETVGSHGKVFVTGEVTSKGIVEIEPIIKRLAGEVEAEVRIVKQSPEIAGGVDTGGAGDQGIMVGYATNETPELLPLEVVLSRRLNQHLYEKWPYDGKTQVTLSDRKIDSVVASFQNAPKVKLEKEVKNWLEKHSNQELSHLDEIRGSEETRYEPYKAYGEYRGDDADKEVRQKRKFYTLHVNPAGDWSQGGFDADAGLTGRKLIVDNYGPRVPIGGGCFSGKDPSKVDRSAAYMARKIALDYLKKYDANEVHCSLAYAIGYHEPLEASVTIDGKEEVVKGYDLTPNGIIEFLNLRRPIYEGTARYGHFGHSEFPWEKE